MQAIKMSEQTKAKVIFAGAGPGDPDLITMKAARYRHRFQAPVHQYQK
jgi:precorrin-4 methylase